MELADGRPILFVVVPTPEQYFCEKSYSYCPAATPTSTVLKLSNEHEWSQRQNDLAAEVTDYHGCQHSKSRNPTTGITINHRPDLHYLPTECNLQRTHSDRDDSQSSHDEHPEKHSANHMDVNKVRWPPTSVVSDLIEDLFKEGLVDCSVLASFKSKLWLRYTRGECDHILSSSSDSGRSSNWEDSMTRYPFSIHHTNSLSDQQKEIDTHTNLKYACQ